VTIEAFLMEMTGLVPYEKRTVKGLIARQDMARKLLLTYKADRDLLERAADTLQNYAANDGDYNDSLAMEIYDRLKGE
jgi:hypothetical protein